MTLFKHILEDIKKYSFITRIEFKNAQLFLFYNVDGIEKFKKLPYRATKDQVQLIIENIKKETGFYEARIERKKKIEEMKKRPLAFAISTEL